MAQRHRDALLIVDPGAVNPSAIAHSIIAGCKEARDAGENTYTDSAIYLMISQLAYIFRMEDLSSRSIYAFGRHHDTCKQRASDK